MNLFFALKCGELGTSCESWREGINWYSGDMNLFIHTIWARILLHAQQLCKIDYSSGMSAALISGLILDGINESLYWIIPVKGINVITSILSLQECRTPVMLARISHPS